MAQNRFNFATGLPLAALSLLNVDRSLVISSAMKMNSMHDPKNKLTFGIAIKNVAEPPTNCNNHAIGYPDGVFQSNGNLVLRNSNTLIKVYNFKCFFFRLCALNLSARYLHNKKNQIK